MDRRFRGPSPEKYVHNTVRIDSKELKKIKVEIKRKIPGADNQPQELDHSLERPEEIKIYRCHGEGSRPIFARQDIVVNQEDSEHRIVSSHSPRRSPRRDRSDSSSQRKGGGEYSRRSADRDSPRRNHRESPRRNRESSYRSHDNSRRTRESPPRRTRDSPRRTRDSPHRSRDSPRRNTRHTRDSPRRLTNRPGSSRTNANQSSRKRSRSVDSTRRSRRTRSRSRSSRREFARRRNTRSPDERDRRRLERKDYGHLDRDRRRARSRSPRYGRSPARRRSRSRPAPVGPLDANTLGAIPLIIPPDINFYGPEDAIWFPAPLRPPMMLPRGLIPPRGMYRAPMYGVPPRFPPRPPYIPMQRPPHFAQIRGAPNRAPRVPQ